MTLIRCNINLTCFNMIAISINKNILLTAYRCSDVSEKNFYFEIISHDYLKKNL